MSSRFAQTARTIPARFASIGSKVEGPILSIEDVPVPEFVDGRVVGPKFDVSGTIITQADITVDNGGVTTLVHARGGISFAIATELESTGADDLHVGDVLSIEYVGNEDMGDDLTPAKVYAVSINGSGSKRKSSK